MEIQGSRIGFLFSCMKVGDIVKQYEKEILQAQLDNEKKVLKQLEDMYEDALAEINDKIAILLGRQDSDMQYVVYQVEFQKSLKKQVEAILETMHSNEFETISEYLANCYNEGYLGAMYSLQKQGIPLVFPISQEQVLAAIQTESNLSTTLYEALGHNVKDLQKKIAGEISRGIAGGQLYTEIARNIAGYARIPKNNAMRIVRTEANRIQNRASMDACKKAESKGADVVKQWDASLDKRTRRSHRYVDGEIRELDEPFSNGLMYPSDPDGDASEVINCRCALLQRARWAVGNDFTKWGEDAPVMIDDDGTTQFHNIEAKNYDDFKKQYLQASERVRLNARKIKGQNVLENNGKSSKIALYRSNQRKEKNTGAFSNLEIPMQKRAVKEIAQKYGIDLSGITIKIQRSEGLLSLSVYGATDPDNIGRIDLFPNAFQDEEQLVRTLVHEKCHVEQLKKYGKKYTQEHLHEMEQEAYAYEEEWWNSYKKKKVK